MAKHIAKLICKKTTKRLAMAKPEEEEKGGFVGFFNCLVT